MATTKFADVLTDQRLAEVMSADYLLLAADRNALPNHPALMYLGDFAGSGAGPSGSVRKLPLLGLDGFDLPTQIAEGGSIVPGTITDQQFSIGVARFGKGYQPSDEVRWSDSLGIYNVARLAADALQSHNLQLTNLIASLVGGFSTSQSTTGVNLTVAVFLAAIGDLERVSQGTFAEGDAMAVLHGQQVADLRSDFATASSGAIQWAQIAQDVQVIRGNGYRGRYFGVDVFASGYVPSTNAGADRAGGIFVKGGIAWADATPSAPVADSAVIGKVLYEQDRNAPAGLTSYLSASWLGATRGYDTAPHQMGVGVISDL